MISIIIGIFGKSFPIIDNAKKVINFYSQYSYIDIVLIDLIPEGSNSRFTNLPKCVTLKELHATPDHEYLFQKESLWNYAIPFTKYETLLFLDGDVICEDNMWLPDIYEKLQEDDYILQPFNIATDTSYDDMCYKQSFLSSVFSTYTTYDKTYGYAVAIRKSTIQRFGGFNNWAFTGTSDMLFFNEHAYHLPMFPDGIKNDWVGELKNVTNPHDKYDFLPNTLIHLNHGPISDRYYGFRDFIVENTLAITNKKVPNLIEKDANGLLVWRHDNLTKEFIQRMYSGEFKYFNYLPEQKTQLQQIMMESAKKYNHNQLVHSPKTYALFLETYRNKKYDGWGAGITHTETSKKYIELKQAEKINLALINGWGALNIKDTSGYILLDYKLSDNTILTFTIADKQFKNCPLLKQEFQKTDEWTTLKVPFKAVYNENFNWSKVRLLSIISQTATLYMTNISLVIE